MKSRFPHELSGGQQQRVALARALAPSPRIVLLDEPFGSLDAGLREATARAVAQALREMDATAILVTHDQDEALSMADKVAVMRAGRIVQADSPQELYRNPADLDVALFVGEATTLPASVSGTQAVTELGRFEVEPGAPHGECTVLVRPEQFTLSGCDDITKVDVDAARARVTDVRYYGHDALVGLEYEPTNLRLVARVVGAGLETCGAPEIGARIGVAVNSAVLAFDRN
jgi:iron(III) transport system ATP-binding protein